MRRATLIKDELFQTQTVEGLTEVFGSIASIHIAKIRSRVIASKAFFAELWPVYTSLRVDEKTRLRARKKRGRGNKNAVVVVTSEGKFGGGMNDKVLEVMMTAQRDADTTDIIAIGSYGAGRLRRHKEFSPEQVFAMPPKDTDIEVAGLVQVLEQYEQVTVFYQTYESLRVQKPMRIDLRSAVRELGEDVGDSANAMSIEEYIFEPALEDIIEYMESVMMGVALTQIIMEAKLADYASRFNTMSLAKKRAGELVGDFRREFSRAKRNENDERLKEAIKAFRYKHKSEAA